MEILLGCWVYVGTTHDCGDSLIVGGGGIIAVNDNGAVDVNVGRVGGDVGLGGYGNTMTAHSRYCWDEQNVKMKKIM